MGLSKRLRFEVFKRDGFRCRYCGAPATSARLEADHVVPKSDGGPDEAANLVTACFDCNRGKSNVPLDESRLARAESKEDLLDHAMQIREYLAAQRERDKAEQAVGAYLMEVWEVSGKYMPDTLQQRLPGLLRDYPLDWLAEASRAAAGVSSNSDSRMCQYFYGVLRKKREATSRG